MIKIVIDTMNGEIEFLQIINASLKAIKTNKELKIILVGDKKILSNHENLLNDNLEFIYSNEIVEMTDDPIDIFFKKKASSLMIALNLLKNDYANAMVSMANTGALMTCASLVIKKIRKIRKAALCAIIPTENSKTILLDCGANISCSSEIMLQFAIMGKFYSEKLLNISNPKIALLNIGIEQNKGRIFEKETYELFNKIKNINFIGNIEPLQLFDGIADIIICDGFIGNITLKSIEATSNIYLKTINKICRKNVLNKICAYFLKKDLKLIKEKFSSKEIGGVPLLGISKPIIKAHGNSDELSIYNAILQANKFYKQNIIQHITKELNIQ